MPRACYFLSVEEKDAFLAANPTYSVVSGPHSSQEECEEVCSSVTGTGTDLGGGSGILTGCCENGLPAQLTATMISDSGLCDVSVPAFWDADNSVYVFDLNYYAGCPCAIRGIINLVCQDGAFYLVGLVNAGPGFVNSCDPLSISFTPDGSIGGCGGGVIIITE